MAYLIALISGVLFGAGLIVSGMSNPMKVLDFLDIASMRSGRWDPTLLAVFAGALPVMFLAYRLRGTSPLASDRFDIPADGAVDMPLIVGSGLFGIGWGLVGFCPGPAIVALAIASRSVFSVVLLFFGAMLAGVWLAIVLRSTWTGRTEVPV